MMRKLLLALTLTLPLLGQNAALLPDPHIRFTDSSGRPLALGKVYFCVAGTSCPGNPLATYTDSTAVTQNANPVILDAGGYAAIWIGGGTYKLVAQNALGVQQWTQDNVSSTALATAGTFAGSNGAGLINYTSSLTGSVTRTVAAKFGDTINAADFGAVCDGSTDNATAFGKLAAVVNSSAVLYRVQFPAGGTCVYSGGLWFTKQVIVDLGAVTLNYTGTGNAIELGSRTLTVNDVAANRYYEVRGGILTGGGSMSAGIYFNPWITEPRVTGVRELNFGNAAAYGIFFYGQNWDAVVQDSSFIVEANATNIQRNWIWNAGTNDNGQSRLRVIHSHGTHLVAAGGVGIYTNGFNSEISSSKIEGFTPNIVIGSFASATTISNVYMEGTRPGLKGCIQYGDLSGTQIGTYIRNLHVVNTYCNVHNTDASLTTSLVAPSTTSTGLTYAILEGDSVAAKTAGIPLVALNNNAGQIGNYATNNWMLSQDGATWSWIDVAHTAGANITGWAGTQGESLDWTQAPTDAPRFFDIKSGATADQFEGIRLFDKTGANKGQIYRTPTGYLTLSSGSADGIIFNSDGSLQFPKGAVDNSFFTLNSPAIGATPLIINGFPGQTGDLTTVAGNGNTFTITGAGVPKVNTSVGVFATVSCAAGTHISGITVVGGIVTAVGACN